MARKAKSKGKASKQGRENPGRRHRKTEDRGQPTTPAIEAVTNSVWCYDGPQAQEERKPQLPASMLRYLQIEWAHLISHFDIPGSLKKLQTKFTRLWASSIVYEYFSSRVPTVDPYLHDDTVLSEPITTTSPYDTVIDPTIATPHSNMDYFNSAASAVLRNNNPMLAVPSEPVPSAKAARKLMSS
ncbi:hypothetical protein D6D15_08529 [Aureobasidium pullulans]|uniref:Uncharacterized protein n=1 Tax=Aureobasidium pullulans TaxID=5580 RepID=A0A4S9AYZ0_AURPU|nr:hypothetical protein D6D15_08529 [Aureobasidium pullulans]